jgi:hypothetical protein
MKLKDIINEGKPLSPKEVKELQRIQSKANQANKDYNDALKSLQNLIKNNETLADRMKWVDKIMFKWVKTNDRENLWPSTLYNFVSRFLEKM